MNTGPISFYLDWGEGVIPKLIGKKSRTRVDSAGKFDHLVYTFKHENQRLLEHMKKYVDCTCVWIENELRENFSHRTACFFLPELRAEKILAFHLSLEGTKSRPTNLREMRFFASLVLSNLSYAVMRPRSFLKWLSRQKRPPWSYPVWIDEWKQLPRETFLVITDSKPNFVVLAPAYAGQTCRLVWRGRLICESWGFDSTKRYPKIPGPILAWGNVYHAVRRVFEVLATLKPIQISRKHPLTKLGWCTWNAMYTNLSREKIVRYVQLLKKRGVEPKFVIIDDGWGKYRSRMLSSMEPRFDLSETINLLKRLGVERVGLWHALQGYWMGLENKTLAIRGSDGRLMPTPEFFEEWYKRMVSWGVDFIKLDNQFDLSSFRDLLPIERAAQFMLEGVKKASSGKFSTVINCMAMVPECFVNFFSPVCRVSNDYPPDLINLQKKQLIACFYNSLWISSFCVPDFDMFESYGKMALAHAMARVLSSGPVYFTDEPWKTNPDLISRMCLDDWEIARADFPATVCEDCLFVDPFQTPTPLKVRTLCGDAVLIGVFNLYKKPITEEVTIRRTDVGLESCVMYTAERKTWGIDEIRFQLHEGEAEIVVAVPLEEVSIVGVKELLIPPAGVRRGVVRKTGTLLLYSRGGVAFRGRRLEEGLNEIPVRSGQRIF